ncbi:cobalamin biosynthesis protein CobG [Streptomyces sp. NPDC026206]|uniref:cobalamin biosynthesis protein CobG n=1 Tax=Streptomyces sp. NPDC026206 TaxID=3157089 RepID=UPI0033C1E8A1
MPVPPTSPADRDETCRTGATVRDRVDACPGALRLHAADDGALARIRVPAGLLTARQAMVLADIADGLGDGNLDITSRGNLQIRGLPEGCGGELGGRLRAAGLLPSDRYERARNVVASPLCGLDGRQPGDAGGARTAGGARGDVQAWARALDALLCADSDDEGGGAGGDATPLDGHRSDSTADLSGLSGRFLFGLDDGRGDIVALGPDVTLIAGEDGRNALLCFGTDSAEGALRIAAADAPHAALLAAREFLAARRESGSRAWRVRDLAPGQRPGPGRLAERLAAAGIACTLVHPAAPPVGTPPPLGPVHGNDGRWALSVAAPLGRLTTGQWRLLARTADRDGDGELRVTPWRGIVVPGLTARSAADRLAALADAGLVTSPGSAWHHAGACTGRPGCAKSLADVRADAAACLTGVRPGGTGQLPVYWSGCERRCGHPAGGRWVDVLATGDGYRVTVRNGAQDETVRTVTAEQLAGTVAKARTTATTPRTT